MQTYFLLKISMITALAGIVLLLFFSQNLEPPIIKISEVNERKLDSFVKIQGNIVNIKETENLIILKINDTTAEIPVILYENKQNKEQMNFIENMQIEVIGKVIEYYGEIEIEANKIKKI